MKTKSNFTIFTLSYFFIFSILLNQMYSPEFLYTGIFVFIALLKFKSKEDTYNDSES